MTRLRLGSSVFFKFPALTTLRSCDNTKVESEVSKQQQNYMKENNVFVVY